MQVQEVKGVTISGPAEEECLKLPPCTMRQALVIPARLLDNPSREEMFR